MLKSNYPQNLVTWQQQLPSSVWDNLFRPDFSFFSHTGGFMSMDDLFTVIPQHWNLVLVQDLSRPLQNLHFIFSTNQDLLLYWLIVLLYNPHALEPTSGFSGKEQNSWVYQLQRSV
ncbi:hypothetical protein ATANTOWER_015455 [Ataeniobius toweri]|uniref:Uncharacterized protein n=1 Tax=Ataeniobius toweri TaxID=208326 RepID=A0ABU7CE06_9TELE|nr:hypothetical protein [Ataeniobius toweri]